ncbi:M20/M25/M40 family metallo-hydrolase [Undibacterium sp. Ji50W]|uniref:M20/M25/M40 family metallo-hydrolase n=1 Tax=Undibacterium sp. Ji50W TaxID=3413041 RepID=UPI003BF272BD
MSKPYKPRTSLLTMTLLAALGLHTAAKADDLSATEQKIVAAVQARSDAALQLLERSVNINSGTLNHEGVRAVGKLYRAELDGLGFKTSWSDMPAAMNRAGHLLAEREGTQGKRVLLIGHLDTVFEKDSPVQLWDRRGDKVRGQGVNDMKGGDVIIIEALRALHAIGALDNTRIQVIFSGDEESAGHPIATSRADLINAAKRSDLALAFEGTSLDSQGNATGTIGRRASGGFVLDVKAKQGHSAAVFGNNGYGAIYEAARILNSFREQLIEPDLTFNPGNIVGGTEISYDNQGSKGTAFGKTNVIAPTAQVHGDLRYLTAEQGKRAADRMRDIVAKNLPGTTASISFYENYPPMSPTIGNLALLEIYSKASKDAGLGAIAPFPPGLRGAGDIQFVAPFVDSLDGLGATGNGAHSPDEDLDIKSIQRATIRTAIYLYRLTR